MSIFDTLSDHGVTASKYRKNTLVTGDQLNLKMLQRLRIWSWAVPEWRIDGIGKDPDSDSIFIGGYSTSTGDRYIYKLVWNNALKMWEYSASASPAPAGNPSKILVPSGQSFFFNVESSNVIKKRNKSNLAIVASLTVPSGSVSGFKVAPTNDKLYICASDGHIYVYDFNFTLIRTITTKFPANSTNYGWAGKYCLILYMSASVYYLALYDCETGTETLNTTTNFFSTYSGMANEGIVTSDGYIVCLSGGRVLKIRISDISIVSNITHPTTNYAYDYFIINYDKDYYLVVENNLNNYYKGRLIAKATMTDAGYPLATIDFAPDGYGLQIVDLGALGELNTIYYAPHYYNVMGSCYCVAMVQTKFKLV